MAVGVFADARVLFVYLCAAIRYTGANTSKNNVAERVGNELENYFYITKESRYAKAIIDRTGADCHLPYAIAHTSATGWAD